MHFSKGNLILILVFVGGIIMPTAILSFLGFRNIQNEMFLAQKNFDENQAALEKDIEEAIAKEQEKIYQETKAASLFLYEQPRSLLEFGNAASFKDVSGIEAIFLYNNGKLVYPDISSKHFYPTHDFSSVVASPNEQRLFEAEQDSGSREVLLHRLIKTNSLFTTKNEQVLNILGIVRLCYKEKNYDEALKWLKVLENNPHLQGYLHADLTRSVNLLHFEILVKQKKHAEAEDYSLSVLNQFLQSESIEDIPSAKFFFETAFSQILSFEDLSQEKRESFWNLRSNFNRQLEYMEILSKYRKNFEELLNNDFIAKDGIQYRSGEDITLFKMGYPFLSGNQIVIAKIDAEAFRARLIERVKNVSQRWKNVPFSIIDEKDSLLAGSIPDSSNVVSQSRISEAYDWEFSLYEKDISEIRRESRQRMYLMYGLLLFSLITVIFGSFFMFRFIVQERRLLAMKANFLSSVSHELKTPLTSIKMFAEMMARGRVAKVEKVQEYSGLIGKEATRLENLIGAILNYTRMEHGTGAFKWERLDFSVCAKKVFDAVEDIGVEKGLEFHTKFEPGAYVMGDYTALYSLAQNLIENAIKYTNAPGEITISVYNEEDRAVFSVADTGIGIDSSEQKNIFNDFYRVGDEMTRSTKGSGLGLAIVKRVAETHKATISLSSKLGKGSTFTVRFKKVD
ncbi:MAG: histidine kinase [Fibrobacter sp.]|nr:histidine kinase [Fibrobacter sp.]